MIGYLLGLTSHYTWWFPFLAVITINDIRKVSVAFFLLMIADQVSSPFRLNYPELFFIFTAAFDVLWMTAVLLIVKDLRTRACLYAPILLSFAANLYCQLDQSNHLVYQYWEPINWFAFEWIIAALLYKSSLYMWVVNKLNTLISKIKSRRADVHNKSIGV